MPTIDLNLKDLENLIGQKLPKNLDELFMFVKGEIDKRDKDYIKLDVKETNRPDWWSTEGIARELKGKLGIEKGIPKYETVKGDFEVTVNENLKNVRSLIACAVIKDITITENVLEQLIQLQEKICWSFGRKRKEAGLGLYDADQLAKKIEYKGMKDNEVSYIPLGATEKMSPKQILKEHQKGKEFANLLEGNDLFPIVIDENNEVASMPPIINSEKSGKITTNTKNLFIEVTGTKWEMVTVALNVITMALADRGGKIELVKINFPSAKDPYPGKEVWTPHFSTKIIRGSLSFFRKRSGLELKERKIEDLLRKARYEAFIEGETVHCAYPNYRNDILHQVDVLEDLLISKGYNNIVPEKIKIVSTGSERVETQTEAVSREACIGMGLQEVLTFTLTSKVKQIEKMNLDLELVEIANYMSLNYHAFRRSLIPELLELLAGNKDVQLPHKVFEIGKTVKIDSSKETQVHEKNCLCVAITNTMTNFTEIKQFFEEFCKNIEISYKLEETIHPSFIKGRVGKISVGNKTGIIGEIHPQVLENFGIETPVSIFELEL